MKFVKLTRKSDHSAVYVNANQIVSVYPYFGRDTTVVAFPGNDDCYEEVLESPESIMNLLKAEVM